MCTQDEGEFGEMLKFYAADDVLMGQAEVNAQWKYKMDAEKEIQKVYMNLLPTSLLFVI